MNQKMKNIKSIICIISLVSITGTNLYNAVPELQSSDLTINKLEAAAQDPNSSEEYNAQTEEKAFGHDFCPAGVYQEVEGKTYERFDCKATTLTEMYSCGPVNIAFEWRPIYA